MHCQMTVHFLWDQKESYFAPHMSQSIFAVIGGGAAGFFCAVNAARLHPEKKVIIVEKSNKLLSKVKVSGGGRCNVTHDGLSIPELLAKYPRGKNFLKKAFHHFGPADTVRWFADRGVVLKTEPDGRMFPMTNSSQTIIDCFIHEANKYQVEIMYHAAVDAMRKTDSGQWQLQIADGREIKADDVCVACGGFPKTEQFDWLVQLGHTVASSVPSLFTFNIAQHSITQLMGVSVPEATVKIVGEKLQESGPLLITHWGLSGPAVLKTSAYGARMLSEKDYTFSILINWLGHISESQLRNEWPDIRSQQGNARIFGHNPFGLPNRLWEFFLKEAAISPAISWAEIKAAQQNKLIQLLTAHPFDVKGKTTFKDEFVTCGGIKLSEINPNTMQSRIVPNLYFAGEIIDVDGVTGGFNFQNAWTTGWIAAQLRI